MRILILAAVTLLVAAGTCVDTPQCLSDHECPGSAICVAGTCETAARTCSVDSNCIAPDRCNNGMCIRPGRCFDDAQCAADFRCQFGLCAPIRCTVGSCPEGLVCAIDDGACTLAPCADDLGCAKGLTCDLVSGMCKDPDAIPAPERCDGIDNDLDQEVDEGFALGDPCSVGVGVCERVGVTTCAENGSAAVCSSPPGEPEHEQCDGLDNDCDGAADEDFAELGLVCAAGLGQCAPGVMSCREDGSGVVCSPLPGVGPSDEICDEVDNDCDGSIDDTFPLWGEDCVAGMGACAATGTWLCSEDHSALSCVAALPEPTPEVCDSLDNDCDGETDEGLEGCMP